MLKTAVSLYRGAKSLASPLVLIRDFLIQKTVSKILAVIVPALEEKLGQRLTQEQRTFTVRCSLPTKMSSYMAENPRGLEFVVEVLNDALSAPLAAVGYSIGKISAKLETSVLIVVTEVGLLASSPN